MSSVIKSSAGLLALVTLAGGAALPGSAQEAGYLAEFERPYGFAYGEEAQPFEAGTRDRHDNRVIVNGRILTDGSTLAGGLTTQWGQTGGASGMLGTATAVGNQLNVITQGSFNTVIIDSTQINNGDQTVVLNGELNLND